MEDKVKVISSVFDFIFQCASVFLKCVSQLFFHFLKEVYANAVGGLLMLISFSQSIGLPSFSPGISCYLSWKNLSSEKFFTYYLNYFIYFPMRVLSSYQIIRTTESTRKTSQNQKIFNRISQNLIRELFSYFDSCNLFNKHNQGICALAMSASETI